MLWTYVSVAAIVAVVAFVVADCGGTERPALCAVTAGLIWPLLIAGLAQFVLIAAAHMAMQGTRSRAVHDADAVSSTGV